MMVCGSVNEYDSCVHSIWEKGQLMLTALNREPLETLNSQSRLMTLCVGLCIAI